MLAGLARSRGRDPFLSPLYLRPRTAEPVVTREKPASDDENDETELESLDISQKLILLNLCVRYKNFYVAKLSNLVYYNLIASEFWETSHWEWFRVMHFLKDEIHQCCVDPYKVVDNPEGQAKRLLLELMSHIHLVEYPIRGNAILFSHNWWLLKSPRSAPLNTQQGSLKRTASQAGLDDFSEPSYEIPRFPGSCLPHASIWDPPVIKRAHPLTKDYIKHSLFLKSREARYRDDFEEANALLNRIRELTINEPFFDQVPQPKSPYGA